MIKDEVYYNPKTNSLLILATLGQGFFIIKTNNDTYIIQGKEIKTLLPKNLKINQIVYIGDL